MKRGAISEEHFVTIKRPKLDHNYQSELEVIVKDILTTNVIDVAQLDRFHEKFSTFMKNSPVNDLNFDSILTILFHPSILCDPSNFERVKKMLFVIFENIHVEKINWNLEINIPNQEHPFKTSPLILLAREAVSNVNLMQKFTQVISESKINWNNIFKMGYKTNNDRSTLQIILSILAKHNCLDSAYRLLSKSEITKTMDFSIVVNNRSMTEWVCGENFLKPLSIPLFLLTKTFPPEIATTISGDKKEFSKLALPSTMLSVARKDIKKEILKLISIYFIADELEEMLPRISNFKYTIPRFELESYVSRGIDNGHFDFDPSFNKDALEKPLLEYENALSKKSFKNTAVLSAVEHLHQLPHIPPLQERTPIKMEMYDRVFSALIDLKENGYAPSFLNYYQRKKISQNVGRIKSNYSKDNIMETIKECLKPASPKKVIN